KTILEITFFFRFGMIVSGQKKCSPFDQQMAFFAGISRQRSVILKAPRNVTHDPSVLFEVKKVLPCPGLSLVTCTGTKTNPILCIHDKYQTLFIVFQLGDLLYPRLHRRYYFAVLSPGELDLV